MAAVRTHPRIRAYIMRAPPSCSASTRFTPRGNATLASVSPVTSARKEPDYRQMATNDRNANSEIATFRKPVLEVFGCVGILALTGIFIAAALLPSPGPGSFFGALIFAAMIYAFWLVGIHSAVRISHSGVIVDNMLVRHVIPWGELGEIRVRYGLEFALRDGRRIGSVMYGGSVIGALLGYRYTRGVAARMTAAGRALEGGPGVAAAAGGTYRRVSGFSAWPPLAILMAAELIALISNLAS